jgi:hypothetical protein
MYATAVYNRVQSVLVNSALSPLVKSEAIIINIDDRPWATTGTPFIIIHPSQRYNPSVDTQITKDRLVFSVTVGARTRVVPTDRLGLALLQDERTNLEVIQDIIIATITNTFDKDNNILLSSIDNILNKYNSTIRTLLGSSNRGIVDGFRFLDVQPQPVPRYAEYFGSNDKTISITDRPAGHTITSHFLAPLQVFSRSC